MSARLYSFLAAFATLSATAVETSVSVTGQSYDSAERTMTVTYSLVADAPMIVTLNILDAYGNAVDAAKTRAVRGDVNRLVEPGDGKRIVWHAVGFGGELSTVNCRANVQAWAVDNPPDVMVIDLVKRADGKYDVAYYPSLESIPDGLTKSLEYKTTKLVMKHVHRPVGGKWIMGSYDECSASQRGNETQHEVSISGDYWLGVFELTQYQAYLINDNANLNNNFGGAYWKGDSGRYETRPLENTCFNFIRGATVYPAAPSDGCILGKLKTRCGYAFDFPSEVQWEYAARAGHAPGMWGDGSAMALNGSANPWTQGEIADTNLNKMACYRYNPASGGGTMPVGSLKPNDWGFYDMHGNVNEMCLDYWVNDITGSGGAIQVKVGEQSGSDEFSYRGGAYEDAFFNCRPCLRNNKQARNTNNKTIGVRLCAPIAPVE